MRKFIALYFKLLCAAITAVVGALLFPVTLQVISRYTNLIPTLAVDRGGRPLPAGLDGDARRDDRRPHREATSTSISCPIRRLRRGRLFARLLVDVVVALFGAGFPRIERDLRLRRAHRGVRDHRDVDGADVRGVPDIGGRRLLFLGEQIFDDLGEFARGAMTPGYVAALMFGVLFVALASHSGGVRAGDRLRPAADPGSAARPHRHRLDDVHRVQLVPAARRAVLPAGRESDEHRRHHGAAVQLDAVDGRPSARKPRAINVVLSVLFAGVSGSSTADAASQAKLFINAQVKEGYDMSFSVAITAVSAILAVVIPPSILMIVWGGVFNTSINQLYMAGVLPGSCGRRADADRLRVCEGQALSDLPARDIPALPAHDRRSRFPR